MNQIINDHIVVNEEACRKLSILNSNGSFVSEYLENIYQTIQRAWQAYPRLLVIRAYLELPSCCEKFDNDYIEQFMNLIAAKVKHDRVRAQRYLRARDLEMYYVWEKDYRESGAIYYHCLLMVNNDLYSNMRSFSSDYESMCSRITLIWANTLGITFDEAKALVQIPQSSPYRLNQRDGDSATGDLFYIAGYLCQARVKRYGSSSHTFGCSST